MRDHKGNKSGQFFDDAAGLIGGVAGMVTDIRAQVKGDIASRVKEFADKAELANAEEIERLERKIDDLITRIEKLEAGMPKAKTTKAKK